MSTLTQINTQVKPYATIRRHVSGAWQPLYVDGRGAQVLRIYIQRNTRQNVEAAVKFYALTKGFAYRQPVAVTFNDGWDLFYAAGAPGRIRSMAALWGWKAARAQATTPDVDGCEVGA